MEDQGLANHRPLTRPAAYFCQCGLIGQPQLSFIYCLWLFSDHYRAKALYSYQGLRKLEEPALLGLYRKKCQHTQRGSSRKSAFPTPGQQRLFQNVFFLCDEITLLMILEAILLKLER